jgi:hypothetical protein
MKAPNNVSYCIQLLNELLSEEEKTEIMQMEEMDFIINSHFGLGLWIRNNWLHGYNSDLPGYFKEKGITHEDDMSSEILKEFYKSLQV